MFAVLQHLRAVDEDVLHPNGVLLRLGKGGPISNRSRIENHDIGEHSLFQKTTVIEPKITGRERAQPADRFP